MPIIKKFAFHTGCVGAPAGADTRLGRVARDRTVSFGISSPDPSGVVLHQHLE